MRLDSIQETKNRLASAVQTFSSEDISQQIINDFVVIQRESLKRKLIRGVSGPALALQQRSIRRRIGFRIPFRYDLISLGERYADDASLVALLKSMADAPPQKVLIPGCYLGRGDVQFWLRRGVKHLEGIDVYSLKQHWDQIVPQLKQSFGAEVNFRQATIEEIPFEDGCFDLVSTFAVLEHVRNLEAMVRETARVTKSGGIAWHGFGPLYHSFSGDHCIAAYGEECGYDHLLLSDDEYQSRINDQNFFDRTSDPNMPFWAKKQQFSFAHASEYLQLFSTEYNIEHLVVKITPEGLHFREAYPSKWKQLRDAGLSESDLLIKSISLVLRKK